MKKLAFFLVSAVFFGCAGMDNAMLGYGRFSESVEKFDGATKLDVAPARLPGVGALLGARWSSSAADYVTLVVAYDHGEYGGYTNVRSLSINVDGSVDEYNANGISSIDRNLNIFTSTEKSKSVNAIVVPFEVFEQMLLAEDVRLRLETSDGYEDSVFSTKGALNGAFPALKKLYDRVMELRE